jgi:hypothetical protein
MAYPQGKKERRDLSVVYDRRTGYYLWQLATSPASVDAGSFLEAVNSSRKVIYADADGLVDFVFRRELWVKAYRSRVDSLEAAERVALKEIEQGLASLERGYLPTTGPASPPWPWDYKRIDLRNTITVDFTCFPIRADCKDALNRIASVEKQGSNWRLVLRNRWDQEVILDSHFTLVSAQRLSPPK